MKLLQNPLIKFIGVIAILYFALFANKKNPDSLGNRISLENVKKNFSEVEEKGKFIAGNVKAAREYAKIKEGQDVRKGELGSPAQQELQQQEPQSEKQKVEEELKVDEGIMLKNVVDGSGEVAVVCGSEVEIVRTVDYQVAGTPEKLVIGSNKNGLVEKSIVGMKKGGLRSITIPQDFETQDKKLKKILEARKTPLVYRIVLVSVKSPKAKSGIVCNAK